jgi:hypothetical protein
MVIGRKSRPAPGHYNITVSHLMAMTSPAQEKTGMVNIAFLLKNLTSRVRWVGGGF